MLDQLLSAEELPRAEPGRFDDFLAHYAAMQEDHLDAFMPTMSLSDWWMAAYGWRMMAAIVPADGPGHLEPLGLPDEFKPFYRLDITNLGWWRTIGGVFATLMVAEQTSAAHEFLRRAHPSELGYDMGELYMLALDYVRSTTQQLD